MNETKKINPEFAPDEKKVWRGVSAQPCTPPSGYPEGIYFIAIEELQGAWIDDGVDKYWEEAEGGTEEWDEVMVDDNGEALLNESGQVRVKTVTRERMRARRYVLKMFNENGFVKNAHSGYSGPRKYRS